MDVDANANANVEPRGEPSTGRLLQTRVWKTMSVSARRRLHALSLQYGVNKKQDLRQEGVSLTMLASNDQYPAFDVESG